MQMDKLTIKAQEALQGAHRVAQRQAHQELDGEHLLVALLEQADSLVPDVLRKLGVACAGSPVRPRSRARATS